GPSVSTCRGREIVHEILGLTSSPTGTNATTTNPKSITRWRSEADARLIAPSKAKATARTSELRKATSPRKERRSGMSDFRLAARLAGLFDFGGQAVEFLPADLIGAGVKKRGHQLFP